MFHSKSILVHDHMFTGFLDIYASNLTDLCRDGYILNPRITVFQDPSRFMSSSCFVCCHRTEAIVYKHSVFSSVILRHVEIFIKVQVQAGMKSRQFSGTTACFAVACRSSTVSFVQITVGGARVSTLSKLLTETIPSKRSSVLEYDDAPLQYANDFATHRLFTRLS